MSKVLFVAYDFPPVGGIGVQRITKYVKYMKEFGVDPIVLSNGHGVGKITDPGLLNTNKLERMEIIRVGGEALSTFHHWQLSDTKKIPLTDYPALLLDSLLYGDVYARWFRSLRPQLLKEIVDKKSIDCVWTTSPPNTTHLIGHWLKTHCNVKWIMDCRDPMLDKAENIEPSLMSRYQEWRFGKLEKQFADTADIITTVSKPMIDRMRERLESDDESKFHVLPNGFDSEDISRQTSLPCADHSTPNKKMQLCFVGTLCADRNPQYLIEAINLIISENRLSPENLQLDFAGQFPGKTLKSIADLHRGVALNMHGLIPHHEALKLARLCDVYLIFTTSKRHPGASEVMTGKVFEALGLRKRTLALTHSAPLRQLIQDANLGLSCAPADIREIADALIRLFEEWKVNNRFTTLVDEDVRQKYERRHQAGQLASLIRTLGYG